MTRTKAPITPLRPGIPAPSATADDDRPATEAECAASARRVNTLFGNFARENRPGWVGEFLHDVQDNLGQTDHTRLLVFASLLALNGDAIEANMARRHAPDLHVVEGGA